MKVVKVRTYVHKARGTSRASRAMAPPLFLPTSRIHGQLELVGLLLLMVGYCNHRLRCPTTLI